LARRRYAKNPCFFSVNPASARAQNRVDALTSRCPNLVYKSQADVKPLQGAIRLPMPQ
jgi:hypothetical protein